MTYESTCVSILGTFYRNVNSEQNCRNYGKISQIRKELRLAVQEVYGTFSKNNFLLKSYGRIPTKFGTKRKKFLLKGTSIQLENDETVPQKNKSFFPSRQ